MAGSMGIDKTRDKIPNQCLPHESTRAAMSYQQSINLFGKAVREGATKTSSTVTSYSRNLNMPQQALRVQKLQTAPAATTAPRASDSIAGTKMAGVMCKSNLSLNNKVSSQQQDQKTTTTAEKQAASRHADQPQNAKSARRNRKRHHRRRRKANQQRRQRQRLQQSAFLGPSMRHDTPLVGFSASPYGYPIPGVYGMYPGHHVYYYLPPPPSGPSLSAGGPSTLISYGGSRQQVQGWWWWNSGVFFMAPAPALLAPTMYHHNPTTQLPLGHSNSHFQTYSSWPASGPPQMEPEQYDVNQGPRPRPQPQTQTQTQIPPRVTRTSSTQSTASTHVGGPSWSRQRLHQSQTQAFPETQTQRVLRPWAPEFVPINSLRSSVWG